MTTFKSRSGAKLFMYSILTVFIAVVLLIAATFALYTDDAKVKNHFNTGKMNLTLKRTALEWVALDGDGMMHKYTSNDTVDMTLPNNDNIFGIAESVKMVPLSYYQAELKIGNGEEVAFDYTCRLVFNQSTNDLAKQIRVTVTVDGVSKVNNTLNNITDLKFYTGSLKSTDADQTLVIRVDFLDDEGQTFDNNDVMGKELTFDLVIDAVQSTTIVTE